MAIKWITKFELGYKSLSARVSDGEILSSDKVWQSDSGNGIAVCSNGENPNDVEAQTSTDTYFPVGKAV